MKTLLKLISFAGLALMFVAAILLYNDAMPKYVYEALALVGTVLWFATVPYWMKRRLHHSE
jgi:hypothetical protein